MHNQNIGPEQELVNFILSVDRRLLTLKEFQYEPLLMATDISEKVGRSLQNISRGLKELEKKNVVACVNPESQTWKRYILTETGKQILKILKDQSLL